MPVGMRSGGIGQGDRSSWRAAHQHSLRHYYISSLIAQGVSAHDVDVGRGGHETLIARFADLLEIYQRSPPAPDREPILVHCSARYPKGRGNPGHQLS